MCEWCCRIHRGRPPPCRERNCIGSGLRARSMDSAGQDDVLGKRAKVMLMAYDVLVLGL